ncbi:flavodoxin family protein [Aquimarina rubra]|uniref:Flavodoxin family protein n=2 Tax=Aquimarina rubra TaxID=1920033 RepID=A0ABW5LII9_9FLAO
MNTLLFVVVITVAIWIVLTIVVRQQGPERIAIIGSSTNDYKALIIYNPDPIYNLDEKISRSFAAGLSENGWLSKISTVAAAKKLEKEEQFDLYVFCANTYNWTPDKAIRDHINNDEYIKGKNVVAITLGSGATKRSQRILEDLIKEKEAKLIESREFWLMKSNDESKTKSSNIKIALEMANTFGKEIAEKIKN